MSSCQWQLVLIKMPTTTYGFKEKSSTYSILSRYLHYKNKESQQIINM